MIRVTEKGDRLLIHGPFDNETYHYLAGALESARIVKIPYSAFSAARTVMNAEVLDGAPRRVQWECPRPAPLAREVAYEGELPLLTKPFDHQREDLIRSKDLPAFAFIWEMGTGKTKVSIDTAAYLFVAGKIDAVLIVAPKGVHRQWVEGSESHPSELTKHCAVPFSPHLYQSGAWGKARQAAFEEALGDRTQLVALAINVDAASSKTGQELATKFLKTRRVLMVVDESQTIKTPGSKRTKAITALGKLARYRRTLSGTPITRGTEDIFSQFRFLDPNIVGCATFAAFTTEYCIKGGFEGKQIVGYRNIDRLKSRLAPFSSRRTKAECLSLPPKVYVRRECELSDDQRKLYNEIKKALKGEADNPDFTIDRAVTALTRLRQVVGGTGLEGEALDCPRIDEVAELVEQTDGRVVVWAVHVAEIKRLHAALAKLPNRRVVCYYGEISDKDRAAAIETYLSDPTTIFLANPAAGGRGLNLDGAPLVVYYSHSFNAEHRWQSEDRTHRATTTISVTYVDMVAPKTTDDHVLRNLDKKRSVSDMTLSELRTLIEDL